MSLSDEISNDIKAQAEAAAASKDEHQREVNRRVAMERERLDKEAEACLPVIQQLGIVGMLEDVRQKIIGVEGCTVSVEKHNYRSEHVHSFESYHSKGAFLSPDSNLLEATDLAQVESGSGWLDAINKLESPEIKMGLMRGKVGMAIAYLGCALPSWGKPAKDDSDFGDVRMNIGKLMGFGVIYREEGMFCLVKYFENRMGGYSLAAPKYWMESALLIPEGGSQAPEMIKNTIKSDISLLLSLKPHFGEFELGKNTLYQLAKKATDERFGTNSQTKKKRFGLF